MPRETFEFVIKSFGGKVGWDGIGSSFGPTDATITHFVVDRPSVVRTVLLPGGCLLLFVACSCWLLAAVVHV